MALIFQAVQDKLGVWLPRVQGQYINEDWNPENEGFGAQCWDLAANWSKFLGVPVINTGYPGKWPGWAGNMVAAYPQTPDIQAAYELIPPDQAGMAGDIAVWGDSYKEYYPATHVAVLIRDANLQLLCASQNSTSSRADNPYPKWSSGPATIQYLPRRGLIGFLRPRTSATLSYQSLTTTPQEDDMSAEEVKKIRDDIATVHQTIIQDVGSQLGELSKAVAGLPSLDRDLRAQLDGLPKFDQQVREDLAIKGQQITALTSTVNALAAMVGQEHGLDVAEVKQAVTEAIAAGLKITVEAGSNG